MVVSPAMSLTALQLVGGDLLLCGRELDVLGDLARLQRLEAHLQAGDVLLVPAARLPPDLRLELREGDAERLLERRDRSRNPLVQRRPVAAGDRGPADLHGLFDEPLREHRKDRLTDPTGTVVGAGLVDLLHRDEPPPGITRGLLVAQ